MRESIGVGGKKDSFGLRDWCREPMGRARWIPCSMSHWEILRADLKLGMPLLFHFHFSSSGSSPRWASTRVGNCSPVCHRLNLQFSVPGLEIREVKGLVITVSQLPITERDPEGTKP
jgi:hypothetical protein